VLGIAEKLFIYQTCTGKLLNIIARHYQDITHIAFTDDGSHFVSCGADGNTFVWSLLAATVANKLPGEVLTLSLLSSVSAGQSLH